MRVFLSYASERRDVAERVAAGLRAADHVVFFDQAALRGGDAFHERLRDEIRHADVFVCLLSGAALTPDSYVRTEIDVAVERWPMPANRIVPVLLEDIPIERLPAALQPLHVLTAERDPIAGVLTAVATARRKHSAERRKRLAVAATALGIVVGALFVIRTLMPGHVRLQVTDVDFERAGAGPWPDGFVAHGWIENGTRFTTARSAARVMTRPDGVGLRRVEPVPFFDALQPGEHASWDVALELPASATASFEWRVCADATGDEICTAWQAWNVRRPADLGSFVVLPDDLHRRARAITTAGNGFAVAAGEPNEVVWLATDGTIARRAALDGAPTAIFARGDEVFVGTRDPDAVQVLGTTNVASWSVPFPSLTIDRKGSHERASSRIRDLVATATCVWVTTSDEQGEPVLAELARTNRRWSVPSFYDDFLFDPRSMRMTVAGERVWAGNTNVTPASLHTWSDAGSTTFDGHDVDEVSCADDVAPGDEDHAVIRQCDGELLEVDDDHGKLRIVHRLGRLTGVDEGTGDANAWADTRLARSSNAFALGVTKGAVPSGDIIEGQIVLLPRGGAPRQLLRLPATTIVGVAMTDGAVLALLDSPNRHGLALLRLPSRPAS